MELVRVIRESASEYVKTHPLTEQERSQIKAVPDVTAIIDRVFMNWAAQPEPALGGLAPMQYLLERTTLKDWRQLLIDWAETEQGGSLVKPLREAVRARLDELGPLLVELIDDEAMWSNTSPGKGYAAILAAGLAGDLRYAPAVPPLLKAIEKVGESALLGGAAVHALAEIGEPARDGLYDIAERYKADVEGEPYCRAVEVLTRLEPDERTWQYLKRGLQEARKMVGFYVMVAGDYGDQRALFHLNSLLEERLDLKAHCRRECLESIEMLGGLPTARARAVMAMNDMKQGWVPGKVGRNDPCPCGSGKKYKKCCGK